MSGATLAVAFATVLAFAPVGQDRVAAMEPNLQAMLNTLNSATTDEELVAALRQEIWTAVKYLAYAFAPAAARDQAQVLEANRTDKQSGADPGQDGSTSLVSEGSVPAVIGFAVENGGLVQNLEGTSLTVRGNPYGITQMLRGELEEAFGSALVDPPADYLRRFSFAATFDTRRGNEPDADPVFRGDEQQLSGFSLRYEPLNRRAPWTSAFQQRFRENFDDRIAPRLVDLNRVRDRIVDRWLPATTQSDWATAAATSFGGTGDVTLEMLYAAIDDLQARLIQNRSAAEVAALRGELGELVTAHYAVVQTRDNILETLNKGAILAVEYSNDRPTALPSTHGLRLIAETGIFGGRGDLTFNADVRLWDSTEPFAGVGLQIDRLRDWSLALQLNAPVGAVERGRPILLTFGGRVVQLRSLIVAEEMTSQDAGADDTEMTAEDAMLLRVMPSDDTRWIGQLKLTIPIKEAGVRLPISVSFSNRPDLLEQSETEVRGTFGFTFDLDAILAGGGAG
jgi:hypothetical protein